MKRWHLGLAVFLALALVAAGCAKKSADQASLTDGTTGFDSTNTEELAQLPQSGNSGTSNQQAGVEVLPIETSPVTQMAPASIPSQTGSAISEGGSTSSSHTQQIQTALKNAGLYAGKIDGKLGPASKRAIIAFQQNNGLKADGKVGPKTWAALEPYLSGTPAANTTATGIEE